MEKIKIINDIIKFGFDNLKIIYFSSDIIKETIKEVQKNYK